jgi:hypothetical protein
LFRSGNPLAASSNGNVVTSHIVRAKKVDATVTRAAENPTAMQYTRAILDPISYFDEACNQR